MKIIIFDITIIVFLILGHMLTLTCGVIKINGDLTAIGVFQIHEPNNGICGNDVSVASVMAAEAVKWYIDHLNRYGKLPFQIGYEAVETCRLEYLAAEISNDILYRVMNNETIAGIIGPEYSSEADIMSQLLSAVRPEKQMVQVGYSSTASVLTTGDKYHNFVRIIPNDDIQVDMMIQSMKQLGWNRIALIYEGDLYGQDAANRLHQLAKQEDICISVKEAINVQNGINIIEIANIIQTVILGEKSRPIISGVVLFASSSTVKTIFQWMRNSDISPVPIFMLSEAMNLDVNVFKSVTRDILPTAKGSLVFSPPYREVVEFTDHWQSIFTNVTKFQKESESNPWLIEVFYSVTNCDNRDCTFYPMSDEKYEKEFGSRHLYVSYAILAAHALAKGILTVEQSNQSININNVMRGLTLDVDSDFQWRPQSMTDLRMTISLSGDPVMYHGDEEYELYNLKHTDNKPGFELYKVGYKSDGQTNVRLPELRDYSGNGENEMKWPDIRKGQCLLGSVCAECLMMNQLYEHFIYEPGDIYVVGVVPIFDANVEHKCGNIRTVGGYQAAEAIRFAVDKVNAETGDFATLFMNTTVGVLILNSCNNPLVIQQKLFQIFSSGITLSNGTILDIKDKVVGFIAELVSDVSVAVAETLTRMKFVQISYASTLPLLGDKDKFPYFMRVVSTIDAQGPPIIEIVKKLNGNYIQIIYSSTSYGEAGRDAVLFTAKKKSICVVQNITIAEESNPMVVYEKLRKEPHAKIVVIVLQTHKVLPVMSAIVSRMKKGEFLFIGSQTWHRRMDIVQEDRNQVLLGSYSLSFEIYQDQTLRTHMQNFFLTKYKQNPWSMMFLQEKLNCYYDVSFDKSQPDQCLQKKIDPNFSLDYMDTNAYVATLSLLAGTDSFLFEKCLTRERLCEDFRKNPKGLMEHIKQTKLDLDGFGNKQFVFNSNGDGNLGYRIYNIQKDGLDYEKLSYVEVGRYPLEGTFTFEKTKTVNITDAEVISVCPNEQACSGCIEKSEETESKEEETDVRFIVISGFLGLSLLVIFVLIIIVVILCRNIKSFVKDDLYINATYDDVEGHHHANGFQTEQGTEGDQLPTITPCRPISDIPTTDN